MAYSIHKHLLFNVWANTKIAESLHEVSDEIYFREMKSSFPSVAKTVTHIWGAQYIWLRRMQGESLSTWPNLDAQNSKNDSLKGLIQSSADILSFIASKDEAFLSSSYSYKSMKGEPFEDPMEDTLFHVVNHGTYHRGQIVTMLREAGITELPGTDLIHYLRTLKK